MKFDNIKIFAIGSKTDNTFKTGVIVAAYAGKELFKEKMLIHEAQDCTSKAQSDLLAVLKALQCVRPEYRNLPTRVYLGQNTAYFALERDNGQWVDKPKANADIVAAARKVFATYANATIHKFVAMAPEYKRLNEIMRPADGMERDQAVRD
jgi:hypothetical protein